MINLLPTAVRDNITYARRNTKLLHWAIAFLFGIAGVAVIVVFGQFYLGQVTTDLRAQVDQGKIDLQKQKLPETQARVQEISGSLKLTLQVLSRQVLFSKLLQQIGAAMPSGATLTDLSITKVEGGIDLQAKAVNYQTATQVQLNLQDPANKIFSKADILSVTCAEQSEDGYPCQISVRAQFATNNNFTFIPSATTGAKP